ncbi:hypothetical protein MB84_28535 (plasmid) [Pandoraea oxalativorans]|uniref:Uncharacterized protein n=1 Tax=Pandoraea oxalativorans TaxID=573737 RepID=A0A0G3IDQ1_9BURK|nr:hypothetical protein MB84_28535 [Pandoraea oxalativorans]
MTRTVHPPGQRPRRRSGTVPTTVLSEEVPIRIEVHTPPHIAFDERLGDDAGRVCCHITSACDANGSRVMAQPKGKGRVHSCRPAWALISATHDLLRGARPVGARAHHEVASRRRVVVCPVLERG